MACTFYLFDDMIICSIVLRIYRPKNYRNVFFLKQ